MSSPLIPSSDQCCDPCTDPTVVQIQGPQGDPGADGADGTDGINAFSTADSFTMPAEGANVTITTTSSEWMVPLQKVWAQGGGTKGTFEVQSTPTSTTAILKNIEDTAAEEYLDNSAPGAVFPNGTQISPAGQQGPAGADGTTGAPSDATYITQTPNASLSNEQALSTLGTGLVKNTTGTGVLSIGVAGTDFLAPAAIGVTVQGFDAELAAIAGLASAADRLPYFTGSGTAALTVFTAFARTLLADATAAAMRSTLGLFANYGLLAEAQGINVNAVADTSLTVGASRYVIDRIIVANATLSLTTATAGLFTAAGGGGVTLAADQALSALTSSAKYLELSEQAIVGTDVRTEGTLYFRIGTAQGSAGTVSVSIFGYKIP